MTKSRGLRQRTPPWTSNDIAVLKALYPHRCATDIALKLGRSCKSIYVRAKKLGLKKLGEYSLGGEPQNWAPLGAHRINSRGFLQRKIATGSHFENWESVHRLVWKEANGDVPKGHCVSFKEGRFSNQLGRITVDSVELVTRQELIRRNRFWERNPEMAKLYQIKGQITRQVRRIVREAYE